MTPTSRVAALAVLVAVLVAVTGPMALPAYAGSASGPEEGDRISGGDRSTGATPIVPGVFHDTVGASTSETAVRWYRYERRYEGSSVHVGLTAYDQPDRSLEISVLTEDTSCESASGSSDFSTSLPLTAGVVVPAEPLEEDEEPGPCEIDDLLIRVDNVLDATESTNYSLRVVEEPAPSNLPALPEAVDAEQLTYAEPDVGEAEGSQEPGATLADAPRLDDGAYAVDIGPGDVQFFKVPLGWGQRLSAKSVLTALTPSEQETDLMSTSLAIDVLNPLGVSTDLLDESETTGSVSSSPDLLTAENYPVIWRNRADSNGSTIAGDYYIAISMSGDVDPPDDDLEVPYVLQVQVRGDVEGAPEYAGGEKVLGADYTSRSSDGGGGAGLSTSVRVVAAGALTLFGLCCFWGAWLMLRHRPATP